jgi:hypothetical protein
MYRLDQDSIATESGANRFDVNLSDGWGIGGVPNGGYLGYVVVSTLAKALPHPDPFTVTSHYLRPASPGPAQIEVELIRAGTTQSTGMAKLIQGGKEILRMIATFGDLGTISGPTRETGASPLPSMDRCQRSTATPPNSTFGDRVDVLFSPGSLDFLKGASDRPMEVSGFIRLNDGREPDARSLVLFADAFPPPVLHAVPRRYVPTLELTVHVRRKPAPGWLRAFFRTRYLIEGYLEEDGEIWDSEDRLVAISRQMARLAQ